MPVKQSYVVDSNLTLWNMCLHALPTGQCAFLVWDILSQNAHCQMLRRLVHCHKLQNPQALMIELLWKQLRRLQLNTETCADGSLHWVDCNHSKLGSMKINFNMVNHENCSRKWCVHAQSLTENLSYWKGVCPTDKKLKWVVQDSAKNLQMQAPRTLPTSLVGSPASEPSRRKSPVLEPARNAAYTTAARVNSIPTASVVPGQGKWWPNSKMIRTTNLCIKAHQATGRSTFGSFQMHGMSSTTFRVSVMMGSGFPHIYCASFGAKPFHNLEALHFDHVIIRKIHTTYWMIIVACEIIRRSQLH